MKKCRVFKGLDRQFVLAVFAAGAVAVVVSPAPAGARSAPASLQRNRSEQFQFWHQMGVQSTAAMPPTSPGKYEALFTEAVRRVGEFVGEPLGLPIIWNELDEEAIKSFVSPWGAIPDTELANARPEPPTGSLTACQLLWFKERSAKFSDEQVELILSHEAYHCYEYKQLPSADNAGALRLHKWVSEGAADWAGYTVAQRWIGHAFVDSLGHWDGYLENPTTSLPDLGDDYGAIGFYAHLSNTVGPDRMPSILHAMVAVAGSFGTNNDAIYKIAADAGGDDFVDTWAPSFARIGDEGAWSLTGPGITSTTYVPPTERVAAGDPPRMVSATQLANDLTWLDLQAEVVRFTVASAELSGRAHGRILAADNSELEIGDADMCTKEPSKSKLTGSKGEC